MATESASLVIAKGRTTANSTSVIVQRFEKIDRPSLRPPTTAAIPSSIMGVDQPSSNSILQQLSDRHTIFATTALLERSEMDRNASSKSISGDSLLSAAVAVPPLDAMIKMETEEAFVNASFDRVTPGGGGNDDNYNNGNETASLKTIVSTDEIRCSLTPNSITSSISSPLSAAAVDRKRKYLNGAAAALQEAEIIEWPTEPIAVFTNEETEQHIWEAIETVLAATSPPKRPSISSASAFTPSPAISPLLPPCSSGISLSPYASYPLSQRAASITSSSTSDSEMTGAAGGYSSHAEEILKKKRQQNNAASIRHRLKHKHRMQAMFNEVKEFERANTDLKLKAARLEEAIRVTRERILNFEH